MIKHIDIIGELLEIEAKVMLARGKMAQRKDSESFKYLLEAKEQIDSLFDRAVNGAKTEYFLAN